MPRVATPVTATLLRIRAQAVARHRGLYQPEVAARLLGLALTDCRIFPAHTWTLRSVPEEIQRQLQPRDNSLEWSGQFVDYLGRNFVVVFYHSTACCQITRDNFRRDLPYLGLVLPERIALPGRL